MGNIVLIERVSLDENCILSVKPKRESFDMIYRAAMGVRWNSDNNYLYFNTPIGKEDDIVRLYQFIKKAVFEEYGKILKSDNKTVYVNINEPTVTQIARL